MLDVSLFGKDWAIIDAVESSGLVFESRTQKKIFINSKTMINYYALVLKTKTFEYYQLIFD